MHLLKKVRPLLAILGFMALSAACAMAQAEINPDHFDDAPQQAPAMHKASGNHASPGTFKRELRSASSMQEQNQNAAVAGKSTAHEGRASGSGMAAVPESASHVTGQKPHKKLISEAHHHGVS